MMTPQVKQIAARLNLARRLYGSHVEQKETWQAAIDYAAVMLATGLVTTDSSQELQEFLEIVRREA